MSTRAVYRGGYSGRGCNIDHSLPSSAEVKNVWSYTTAPLYAFLTQTSKAHTLHITYTGRTDRHQTDVLMADVESVNFSLRSPKTSVPHATCRNTATCLVFVRHLRRIKMDVKQMVLFTRSVTESGRWVVTAG